MNHLRSNVSLNSWVGGLLLALMLACGGESPAPPPTPPPPAPFQPQVVVVDLGSSGGKTTVVSTQSGGWTRNGEPFTSGSTVTGENGATYRLTLADARWTAEFVPQEPAAVALGNSGDSVTIETQEDGSYVLGGEPIESGSVRTAENGNQYRFSLGAAGTWMAEYVAPDPVRVPLGRSNLTALLIRQEDGTFALDGETIASNEVWEAPNGNSYRFTQMGSGEWTAEFVSGPPLIVALGNSGDTAELAVQENGTYAFNGEPIFSGQVRQAANGNNYRFVQRALGVWEAVYVPPAPLPVPLGTSSDTVSLERLENGDYILDGQSLGSGETRTLANGNTYRFFQRLDGTWRAEFVSAEPIVVALGNSGNTVSVTVLENRNYVLDGAPLASNQVRTINGNRYRFTLGVDGSWQATYEVERIPVRLGSSGGDIVLLRQENGTFTLDGAVIESSQVVTRNGQRYRLTQMGDQWIAEHVRDAIQVSAPGSQVQITLTEREDGQYEHEGRVVSSGDEVTVGESTFELTFSNGRWTAEFLHGEVRVDLGRRGEFITLIQLPDGTYEYEGRRIRSGAVVRGPESGDRYTLRLRGGVWTSRVYVPPTTGGGSGGGTGGGGTPVEVENLRDVLPDGLSTTSGSVQTGLSDAIDSDGNNYDYSRYRGSGATASETFAEAARKILQSTFDSVKELYEGTDAEQRISGIVLQDSWSKVKAALNEIFSQVNGGDAADLLLDPIENLNPENIDVEEALDDLEDLLEAFESEDAFKREFANSGEFVVLGVSQDLAPGMFDARKDPLTIGATDNTRFGVIGEYAQDTTAQTIADGATLTVRSFAWSPRDPSATTELPSRGTARYTGTALAIEPDGDLFSGTINLYASLGIERIVAEITGVSSAADGSIWEHDARAVSTIKLPVIDAGDLEANGSFNVSGQDAEIVYEEFDGLFTSSATSGFRGQFVDSESGNPGEAVLGTWTLSDSDGELFDGSYGAEHESTSRVEVPASDNDGLKQEYFDPISNTGATLTPSTLTIDAQSGDLDVPSAERTFDLNQLYRSRSGSESHTNNSIVNRINVRFRNTRYTRFGAWAHTATTDPPSAFTGVFGYTRLERTTFQNGFSDNDYPRNVTALYSGQTVAVSDDGTLYDGQIAVRVEWSDANFGGTVNSVISSLQGGGGRYEFGGQAVNRLGFTGTIASNAATFESSGVTLQYTTGGSATASGSMNGVFVGNAGFDGPYAVVGNWSITGSGDDIDGAFGADLVPEP